MLLSRSGGGEGGSLLQAGMRNTESIRRSLRLVLGQQEAQVKAEQVPSCSGEAGVGPGMDACTHAAGVQRRKEVEKLVNVGGKYVTQDFVHQSRSSLGPKAHEMSTYNPRQWADTSSGVKVVSTTS